MGNFKCKKLKTPFINICLGKVGKDPPSPEVSFLQVRPNFKPVFFFIFMGGDQKHKKGNSHA